MRPLVLGFLVLPTLIVAACSSSSGGGSPPQALAPLADGHGLVLDGASIVALSGSEIVRIGIADGKRTVLATDQATASLTSDGTNLYWGNASYSLKSSRTEVSRLPLAGGAVTVLAPGPGAHDLTTDGAFVYWAAGDSDEKAAIYKVPVGGGAVTTLVAKMRSYTLAIDGATLYFSNEESIYAVPTAGGTASLFAKDVSGLGGVGQIVFVGDDVVFLAATGGGSRTHNLYAMPRAGGERRSLSIGDCQTVAGIAVDGRDVYASCTGVGRGALISRVTLDGGNAVTLATVPPEDGSQTASPTTLVVDREAVFFGAAGQLYRLAK